MKKDLYNPWNSKVKRRGKKKKYNSLFKVQVPHFQSPCDGLVITTDHPLTTNFENLAAEVAPCRSTARHRHRIHKSMFDFGSVIVWKDPIYPRIRKHRVRINPSAGCMSPQQVLDWIIFIFGRLDGVYIRAIDLKIDLTGADTQKIINTCWAPDFRSKKPFGLATVVYGSSTSRRQMIIYDKAEELRNNKGINIGHSIARIEMRLKFEQYTELPVKGFKDMDFKSIEPFKDVVLITSTKAEFMSVLRGEQKKAYVENNVYETMKAIENSPRKRIIKELTSKGSVTAVSTIFNNQMDIWRA